MTAHLPEKREFPAGGIGRTRAGARRLILFTALLVLPGTLGGCAARHGPVLYPNAHLQAVGEAQAQRDIEDCERLAQGYIRDNPGAEAALSTAGGGAAGAVIGGAAGAVTGSLGRGIGVGAAAGAASGLIRGIVKASRPSPLFKRYVDRCLQERGYEPLGWE
jgi:hypothetical protein